MLKVTSSKRGNLKEPEIPRSSLQDGGVKIPSIKEQDSSRIDSGKRGAPILEKSPITKVMQMCLSA